MLKRLYIEILNAAIAQSDDVLLQGLSKNFPGMRWRRSEGPLLDRTPVSKNMPLFTAPLTSQRLEVKCSRAPPTHQAGSMPAWQVGEVRWASTPHPPTRRATPRRGVLPAPQVGRDQLPLSHKPTASAREPLSVFD